MPAGKRKKEAPAGVKEMLHEIGTLWGFAAPDKFTLPAALLLYEPMTDCELPVEPVLLDLLKTIRDKVATEATLLKSIRDQLATEVTLATAATAAAAGPKAPAAAPPAAKPKVEAAKPKKQPKKQPKKRAIKSSDEEEEEEDLSGDEESDHEDKEKKEAPASTAAPAPAAAAGPKAPAAAPPAAAAAPAPTAGSKRTRDLRLAQKADAEMDDKKKLVRELVETVIEANHLEMIKQAREVIEESFPHSTPNEILEFLQDRLVDAILWDTDFCASLVQATPDGQYVVQDHYYGNLQKLTLSDGLGEDYLSALLSVSPTSDGKIPLVSPTSDGKVPSE